MPILVATESAVVVFDPQSNTSATAEGIADRPTCLAADPLVRGRDRVPGGPWDTHELAVHREAPDSLWVSAGDGYFESDDGGATWRSPSDGLDVGYLRSVAIHPNDPEIVLVSASTGPRSAYVAGRSDGRLYRRVRNGRWERVRDGWPDPPSTIAPLLFADFTSGDLLAADERGVHRSADGGKSWALVVHYPAPPRHLRGLTVTPE
jgi:photosystem II stability/assembly factor-like uncharacterized protein